MIPKKRLTVAAVCVLFLACPAQAVIFETFQAEVVGIKDGDTIVVLRDKREIDIRLNGVDCPEKGQAFGTKAKQWTAMAAFGQMVTVKETSLDKYGRTVADVILPDGKSLNREIVRAGFAWWFRRYSNDQMLKQLEEEARAAKRGLWFDKEPMTPWDFRAAQAAGKAVIAGEGVPRENTAAVSPIIQQEPQPLVEQHPAPPKLVPAAAPVVTAPPVKKPAAKFAAPPKEPTVYVTKSGTKYHSASCGHLKGGGIPMSLSQAKARYSACSRCGGGI